MNDNMQKLIILLCAIAVVLLIVILLFTKKSPFMKLISFFLEERDDGQKNQNSGNVNTSKKKYKNEDVQKKTLQPMVEMATLIRKSDDRLRVIESTGQTRLIDEYYELVFVNRKGKTLKIECSRAAYDKIPFNQQGSLTYKSNKLVKFKFYEGTVFN